MFVPIGHVYNLLLDIDRLGELFFPLNFFWESILHSFFLHDFQSKVWALISLNMHNKKL